MPFEPGRSGNPGGRPRKTAAQTNFEEKCRNWAELFAFDKLRKLADSDEPKAVQWATKEILDRCFGTPVQTSIVDAAITTETGSTVEALAGELAALVGAPKAEGGGDNSPAAVDPGT